MKFLRIATQTEEYVIGLWRRTERKIICGFKANFWVLLWVFCLSCFNYYGIKYALILAILTAFCELIPWYIIAMIPAIIFSYLDENNHVYSVSYIFLILHQFENYLIYPLIVKKYRNITTCSNTRFDRWTFGRFWGIVLAINVSVCLLEFMDDIEKENFNKET